jgi:hypothetical protein
MRTALGAVALAVLIALGLAGGCSKPLVREKQPGDPLFSTRKSSEGGDKANYRPVRRSPEK